MAIVAILSKNDIPRWCCITHTNSLWNLTAWILSRGRGVQTRSISPAAGRRRKVDNEL